jgi:hypothetical protein
MRPVVKPTGFKYLEYVLIYVIDILVVSDKPHEVMDMLSRTYKLKDGGVKKPTEYLGASVSTSYL